MACAYGAEPVEKDTRTPLEAYEGEVKYALIMCKLKLEIAVLRTDAEQTTDSDYRGCISESKKKFKTRHEAAAKTVRKAAARAALKEHYILALATITSLAPESDELKGNYSRRQAENNDRLTVSWSRFEAEN